jgi:hypothetical protein
MDGGSGDFELSSPTVLEPIRKYTSRRLGVYGDPTTNHLISPPQVPSSLPVSIDAVDCDGNGLSPQRQKVLSMHALRTQPKRVSGLQPLLLPRFVSLRHPAAGEAPPSKNGWKRLSPQWIRKLRGSGVA